MPYLYLPLFIFAGANRNIYTILYTFLFKEFENSLPMQLVNKQKSEITIKNLLQIHLNLTECPSTSPLRGPVQFDAWTLDHTN